MIRFQKEKKRKEKEESAKEAFLCVWQTHFASHSSGASSGAWTFCIA
jgi:hypothetical protein